MPVRTWRRAGVVPRGWNMRLLRALSLLLVAALPGCTLLVDTDKRDLGPKPAFCFEGAIMDCGCPDGKVGFQTCNADGTFIGSPCCVPCANGLCDCLGGTNRICQ